MKKNNFKIFNLYFAFTIIYYCFGKYNWNIPSYSKLLVYLIICYLMLNIGYKLSWTNGLKFKISHKRDYNFKLVQYKNIRIIFWISAICLIVFQIMWVVVFFNHFSIFNVFSTIGTNYYDRLETTFDSKLPIMQIRTLLWGITLFVYPIGFIYFKHQPRLDKVLFCTTLLIDVFASLNMGVSKNIGDIVIIFIGITLLKNTVMVSSVNKISKRNINNLIKIIILLSLFLFLFERIQNLRNSVTTGDILNPYGKFVTSYREEKICKFIFGESLTNTIDKVGTYVSHAYTGLAYALEIPFKNTYLIGCSRAAMEYVEQYFEIDILKATYNYRIEQIYGWHNGQWWPTAFVWIANSVSIYFVPFIMLILGMFIRYLEDDFAKSGNIITATLYSQMVITLFYLPCNMQILQSRASLMGTILLAILFIKRKRLVEK